MLGLKALPNAKIKEQHAHSGKFFLKDIDKYFEQFDFTLLKSTGLSIKIMQFYYLDLLKKAH